MILFGQNFGVFWGFVNELLILIEVSEGWNLVKFEFYLLGFGKSYPHIHVKILGFGLMFF